MENNNEEISVKDFRISAFDLWDSDWLLLTSGNFLKGKYNAMTVAWGGFGNMWNLPMALVVVRPTRFTYEFINDYPTFSLCGFPRKYRKALNLLGTKSGRDGDKIGEAGLTPVLSQKIDAPTYLQANLSVECKKIYFQDFDPENFLDDRIEKHYQLKDYHRMIIGEILYITGDKKLFERKQTDKQKIHGLKLLVQQDY